MGFGGGLLWGFKFFPLAGATFFLLLVVDSPFFSTIVLFKTQLFPLGF